MSKVMRYMGGKEVIIIMKSIRLPKGMVSEEALPISNVMFKGFIIDGDESGYYLSDTVEGEPHQYILRSDIGTVIDAQALQADEIGELPEGSSLN